METQPANGILEEFRIEFLDCWKRLPSKGLFFILLAAWLALFHFLGNSTLGYVRSPSLLLWMYTAYQPNPFSDDGHGLLVPFVVLALFWWKRRELMAVPQQAWWPGLVLLALALALHLVGYVAQQPRISILALFAGIYGLMGLAWGPAFLRASFFPFFLFAFCVPLGTLAEAITFPLRLLVCQMVEFISHNLLAIDVVREGTSLKDPSGTYNYDVAVACSGMRSLVITTAVAVILAAVQFRSWPKRLVLVASAVPLAVLGNLLRMMTIVLAASMFGKEWGDRVHAGGPLGLLGLLFYVPAFGGLLLLGHWLREPDLNTAPEPHSEAPPAPGLPGPQPSTAAPHGL